MDNLSIFLQQFITFFAILDPIGVGAIALSLFNKNITKMQISQLAYKYRLYPTTESAALINKNIGCSRFIYNHFLALAKSDG